MHPQFFTNLLNRTPSYPNQCTKLSFKKIVKKKKSTVIKSTADDYVIMKDYNHLTRSKMKCRAIWNFLSRIFLSARPSSSKNMSIKSRKNDWSNSSTIPFFEELE